MSLINPFMEAARYYGDLRNVYFAFDVDLALQPSMDMENTDHNRENMWELFQRTDGGVGIFTGRTHQSAHVTFGRDYEGVYEHYSVARYGHGHDVVYMAPEIDVETMGALCDQKIRSSRHGNMIRIADRPATIRNSQDLAVYIEKKNTSIALVHTTLRGNESEEDKLNHLGKMRGILQPVAEEILKEMGLEETHMVKTGNDAVEMVPKNMDKDNKASMWLPKPEVERLHKDGLSKATAVHNFMALHQNRNFVMTGDSSPDLDAMIVGKKYYNGKGIYVSNGIPLKEQYTSAVDWLIERHEMTWAMIGNTINQLREQAPIVKTMPALGDTVPNLNTLG